MARFLSLPVEKVIKTLEQLNAMEVLTYTPLSEKPLITFLVPRKDVGSLKFNIKRLEALKNADEDRLSRIIGYSELTEQCLFLMK